MTYSVSSSVVSSVVRGIVNPRSLISYITSSRALDLTSPFTSASTTVADRSPESNDATLYSGRYASTDGVTDKAINANCSAAGYGSYRITGKVKTGSTAFAWLQFAAEFRNTVAATAGEWVDFVSPTRSTTPHSVIVGFGEFDGDEKFTSADWSDIRLQKQVGSEWATVARWQLNESADGDLNGYPALDSSGNGYHGTHTGCAGGTGEGIDADVANIVGYDDKMYFAGDNDYVEVTGMTASSDYFGACTISATVYIPDATQVGTVWSLGGSAYRLITNGNWFVNAATNTGVAVTSGLHTISVTYNASGVGTSFVLDGSSTAISAAAGISGTSFYIGARDSGGVGLFGKGLIYDFAITGSSVKNFAFAGDELVTWTDTTGGGNNGTVNGSPVTVGQKRETILQTAGQDWNKGKVYKSASSSYSISSSNAVQAGDFIFEATIIDNGSTDICGIAGAGWLSPSTGFGFGLNDITEYIFAQVRSGANVATISSTIKPVVGQPYKLKLTWDESTNTAEFFIDGVSIGSQSNALVTRAGNPDDKWSIGARTDGGTQQYYFDGIVYDVKLDGTLIRDLDTFIDTATTNYLIPESDTTAGQDALGNAIANPRPTADTWNLFGDGEYGQVADADSLDVTTEASWELWGNFYYATATTERFISKDDSAGTRSWDILKSSISTVDEIRMQLGNSAATVKWTGITDSIGQLTITYNAGTLNAYWQGVDLGAPVVVVGIIPSSIPVGTEPVLISGYLVGGVVAQTTARKLARPKIYNTALTADEVLKNYNAQKGAFGL